jgi:hypothetical protein
VTDDLTGPEMFDSSMAHLRDAIGTDGDTALEEKLLKVAEIQAVHANTAAIVMLGGLFASAMNLRNADLDGWMAVIPPTPLVKCWGKEERRPECAERHTEDCDYADPPPEPKHELLPVGTRVLVSEPEWDNDARRIVWRNPEPGKIIGYDMHRTKYRWRREWNWAEGRYSEHDQWAFVDNRVVIHPDGPECPPPPQPVKREPTGPRVYVRHMRGKQGHILAFKQRKQNMAAQVQWYVPDARPVWVSMDLLTIITADEVDRCPNGQTRDECGSDENQCELCLQAEDEEADAIERSMGL